MRSFSLMILLLLARLAGFGQLSADSALIDQARTSFDLTSTAPDSAYAIANKILQQSPPAAGHWRVRAFAYKTKGWALLRLGNYDSSLSNLLTSTRLFRQMKDTVETMYMYINLASAYSARSQFMESAGYLMQADSLAKGKNDIRIQAAIQKQMGILYRQQQAYPKAIPCFKEGMRLYLTDTDTLHYLDVVMSLSITYNMMSLPDSSLALLNKNMPVMKRLRGYTYQKAMLQERFGDSYLALNDLTKALAAYKRAYAIFASGNNHADQAYEAMNVGRSYTRLKDYSAAEQYLLEAYRLNDSLHMTDYAHDAAEQLSDLYEATHQWQKAYEWLQTTRALLDSLRLTEQNEKIAELQTKYETARKDNEISLLKKDRELTRLTLQKQKTFRYGAVMVLILLILLALLAVNRYRTLQQVKRQVEMEKLRNDIARDLHDDMGSVLSSINIMSKVALESPGENNNIRENLARIKENSNYMLESMSDMVWAINPANDSFEQTLFRMKEFAADILEPLDIPYEFRLSEDIPALSLGLRKRKDLFLLFKEALNNAAKYSRCTKIGILIRRQEGAVLLEVEDNGVGFDTGRSFGGNGLRNMKQRAEQMGGTLIVRSEPGKGTQVRVTIKSHD